MQEIVLSRKFLKFQDSPNEKLFFHGKNSANKMENSQKLIFYFFSFTKIELG